MEVLLIFVLVGITLLGYMIAINSRGPTKLSISYLLATCFLIGTVWAIVQHVSSGQNKEQQEEFRRLEREKREVEERIRSKELSLIKSRKLMEAAAKINSIINQGTGYASNMMNIEFKDFSVELDVLMGRANAMRNKITELVEEYAKLKKESELFPESAITINNALADLSEAAKYYNLYFKAEDTAQEELRERLLRQKSRKAYDLFKKASTQVASAL
ncbi:MAG: hypothetical protein PVI26_00190 [Chitinispirillia bacterium]